MVLGLVGTAEQTVRRDAVKFRHADQIAQRRRFLSALPGAERRLADAKPLRGLGDGQLVHLPGFLELPRHRSFLLHSDVMIIPHYPHKCKLHLNCNPAITFTIQAHDYIIISELHATIIRTFRYYRVKGLFDVGGGSYEG